MTKETLADKIAKKTFNSPEFQRNWAIHMQDFGPILEQAFIDDYQSRVHLTAALNLISRQDFNGGLKKLKSLRNNCTNDGDKAALLFFIGVCFEMAGNQGEMVKFYTYANEIGHGFYLPYLKVARFYLNGHCYDKAEENFRAALDRYKVYGIDGYDLVVLGTAHINLATCLTMMHRYDEAEATLSISRSLYPDAPGRAAAEAVLHAIRGRTDQLNICLGTLKEHAPEAYVNIKESTDKILAQTNPMFYPVPVDEEKISGFWKWFLEYEEEMRIRVDQEESELALAHVAERLLDTFPFLDETPYIVLSQNEDGYILELKDMYLIAVNNAYEKLLQACPEDVKSRWQFTIVR